jgi:RND family efflux transporter MFP subunit
MSNFRLHAYCGAALIATAALLTGCKEGNSYQAPPPPTVTVSPPVKGEVQNYLYATGNTSPVNEVDLVARVPGYLTSILYTDGTMVKKGAPLFVIEQPPYQAQLDQANANIKQQQALYEQAKSEYERQIVLVKQQAGSQANVEKWQAQRDAYAAAILQAKAAAEIAQINFGYTKVNAPFDGRVSRHEVDVGNLVGQGGNTKLATIEQLDPIYVYFNVNEQDVLKIRAAAAARGVDVTKVNGIPIQVQLQDETGYPHAGTLDYVSTGLSSGTGTIQVRASLPNPGSTILPGYFVSARVALGATAQNLLVPDIAVSSDQAGYYVLVVDDKGVVAQKHVERGPLQDGSLRAITGGLAATDKVIVDGLQYAAVGSKVTVVEKTLTVPKPATAAAPAATPAAAR